ncbi:MAG TPA: 23S rRNA (uracil(1939)-C(5))-methyltransferase RlmD [Solirubrobacteraceae bacterium]|nr:23S rRNA (uracil(1939)-C(5))-methyltransferase RlmD [Solirubrobacteraceae bacterium]
MSSSESGPAAVVGTPPRPQRDEVLELVIDSLAFGGAGVARRAGYVIFVSGAVPGDRVRARITKRKRSHAEAMTLEVLDSGPERIDPVADHPGVAWQVIPYERQLVHKHEQVGEALRRIGGLRDFELEPIVAAEQPWRYRNKLEYSFGTGEAGELVCGFHESGRWDRVVALEDCLLASEAGNRARDEVLRWCREQGLGARGPRGGGGVLRNLVVREGRRTGELQLRLVTTEADLDFGSLAAALPDASLWWTRTAALAETTAGGDTELVAGESRLHERLGNLSLAISPEAFFQTNTEMAERLYGVAAEMAGLAGWERVYDLYSGIGTIGLTLAPRAGELWGLEVIESAVADAIANARANEIVNARFFAGDVRLALRELVGEAGRPDVVVLDPPRSGLSAKVIRRVIEAAPRRIVYVSCNPTTLAPNAAQLVEAGWNLRRVRPVDMFPQTPHIECVALLERGGTPA